MDKTEKSLDQKETLYHSIRECISQMRANADRVYNTKAPAMPNVGEFERCVTTLFDLIEKYKKLGLMSQNQADLIYDIERPIPMVVSDLRQLAHESGSTENEEERNDKWECMRNKMYGVINDVESHLRNIVATE